MKHLRPGSRNALVGFLAFASIIGGIAGCSRDLVAPRADAPTAIRAASVPHASKGLGEPRFLEPAIDAPTIANPVITFWAVKGVDRRVVMVYHSRTSAGSGAGGVGSPNSANSAKSLNSAAGVSSNGASNGSNGNRRGGNGGNDGGNGGGGNGGGNDANGGGRDSVVFAEFRVRPRSLMTRPDGSPIADGDSVLITMTLVDAQRGIIEFQPSGLRFSPADPASLKMSFENANLDLNGDGVVDARDRLIQLTFHIAVREGANDPFLPLPSAVSTDLDEVEAVLLGFSGYAIAF